MPSNAHSPESLVHSYCAYTVTPGGCRGELRACGEVTVCEEHLGLQVEIAMREARQRVEPLMAAARAGERTAHRIREISFGPLTRIEDARRMAHGNEDRGETRQELMGMLACWYPEDERMTAWLAAQDELTRIWVIGLIRRAIVGASGETP